MARWRVVSSIDSKVFGKTTTGLRTGVKAATSRQILMLLEHVDVQTWVYKMICNIISKYYVHIDKLMILNINATYITPMSYVLPCLAMSCHVWFNWWLPVAGHWRVRTPTWLDFGQWRSRELEQLELIVSARCIQVLKAVLDTFCTGTAITTIHRVFLMLMISNDATYFPLGQEHHIITNNI